MGVSRCVIEARLDVALQGIPRTILLAKHVKHLFDGIRARPSASKAIAVGVLQCFSNRIQRQPVQGLVRSIQHRRYPQRAQLAVLLGNIHTLQRLRFVAFCVCLTAWSQSLDGFGFWSVACAIVLHLCQLCASLYSRSLVLPLALYH